MHAVRAMAVCGLALLLQACATYRTPLPEPGDTEVIGIAEYIRNAAQAGSAQPVRVDIVATHGMCAHGAEWEAGMIQTIAAVLGLPAPASAKAAGSIGKTVFTAPSVLGVSASGGVQVTLHTIVWSPLVMPAREALCFDVSAPTRNVCDQPEGSPLHPGFEQKRAWANASLKNTLMDGCLVDAIYYAGAGKTKVRRFVSERLNEALQPELAGEPAALFILSESLGSKIVFDVLREMKEEREAAVARQDGDAAQRRARADLLQLQQNVGRTVTVFMAANQIPILSLADDEPGSAIQAFEELHASGRAVLARTRQQPGVTGDLRIVAISDPNDLLTWRLRKSKVAPNDAFVDVTFSDTPTWFGLFAEPFAAHTTYFSHEPIRQLLRDGIHKPR